MKAIAVNPGEPGSIHLEDIERRGIGAIPDRRGVRVQVLRAGVDGTDKEITPASTAPLRPATTTWSSATRTSGVCSRSDRRSPTRSGPAGTSSRACAVPARIRGLENYDEMIRALTEDRGAIKVYVEVAGNDAG
ncbi:MAG: hypothetical protein WAQ33_01335 [Gaiellaceae bacterium]